ncbi:MAG: DegV family protein [Clostridia bacterium]|nr:DegV family protein [Clostridia bacterium]
MSRFFCDADCELDYKIIKELGISLIKMPFTLDGKEELFDCGETTDYKGFFDKMRQGASAKTQALNAYDYVQYFEPVFAAGEDILYVSFSHEMSGTFVSMNNALDELKEKYPDRKCTVVDTKSISMGAGIIVYFAAKLHNEGKTDEEVVAFVEQLREKVKIYFTVDDLVYLKRGGRLTSFKAAMGTILNLKPIIGVQDGKLVNLETAKGRKKALHNLVNFIEKDEIDASYPLIILDADSGEDSDHLKELILESYSGLEIWHFDVGPVIGCHCGPGTLGVIFVSKK